MQGRTTFLVNFIIISFALEIDQAGNFIVLCCHMQNIEFGIVGKFIIGSDLDQIMDKLNVAIEGSIEQGCKSLCIFLVDPNRNFAFGLFVIQILAGLNATLDETAGVYNIQFNQLFLVIEAEMMQNIILLAITELA